MTAGMETAYRAGAKVQAQDRLGHGHPVLILTLAQRQGALLVKLARWYTPFARLVMKTGTNGTLLAMSGKRNPYPGKLGVVVNKARVRRSSAGRRQSF